MDKSNSKFQRIKAEAYSDYLKFKQGKTRLLSISEFKKALENYDI